ncbi:MAG: succinate dehydrogenase cytochrome b subunit [Planctomycetes bacterium]|nr:succinate dehydrogenase cytochrome b subunit [Planctomycetota bacterium]
MKWLLKALSSSVGKKFLMAITGLLLCGFLVAHLAGNLLLPAGGSLFNDYAKKLHENEGLLMVAETGLFAIFILHLWLAFSLTGGNVIARGKGYAMSESKREDTILKARPDKWMIGSGIVLLLYLCLHLFDFKLHRFGMDEKLTHLSGDSEAVTTEVAIHVLQSPLTIIGYAAGFVFLFAHLSHGMSSAFQSLGISHPKYSSLIRYGGLAFAGLISLGFLFVLFWANLQQ